MYRSVVACVFLLFIVACQAPGPEKQRLYPKISDAFIKNILEVQKILEPESGVATASDFDKAQALLRDLDIRCRSKCNEREQAMVFEYLAFIHYQKGELVEAKNYNDRALSRSASMPEEKVAQIALDTAMIALSLGEYDQIPAYKRRYDQIVGTHTYESRWLSALVYYHSKELDIALEEINALIVDKKAEGITSDHDHELRGAILIALGRSEDVETAPQDAADLPVQWVAPVYPRKAALNRIEGYCEIVYDVMKDGRTTNLRTDNCSDSVFEEASMDAAAKFRHRPNFSSENPIIQKDARYRFLFEVDN